MSSRYLIPLAVAAALAAPVAAHAQDEGTYDPGKWLVRVGLSQINPDKENLQIPGAFLVVDSDITPTGTVEYMLTPHIGTGSPFSLFRDVSTISSSRAAVTASSKNSS